MNFDKLKYVRENNDYIQEDVAKILNVERGTYAAWECGSDSIPLIKLIHFANHFSVSIDYLLHLTNYNIVYNCDQINTEIIAIRMKQIRKELNLSLRNMATKLHTSYATLSRNENGKTIPSIYTIYYIALEFDYSIDWITGRSEKKSLKNL